MVECALCRASIFSGCPSQVPIGQVLELLSFVARHCRADQIRGARPIHDSSPEGSRSFLANLGENTYWCFRCGSVGNQLDFADGD